MKKYLIKIAITICVVMCISSCKKFLDVQPKDKFLESQVFSSESGINAALNGVYLGMAQSSLYGGNLTMSAVEVLAQRYSVANSTHSWKEYGNYNYNDLYVKTAFDKTWSDSYKLILSLNVFIKGLNNNPGVINAYKTNILKGEAYGLRAMIHFDLLRLFGPVYATNSTLPSIPYYTQASATAKAPLPANQVMDKVFADLDTAAQLLVEDPIIANGIQASVSPGGSNFYRYRNLHLNIYAIKALQARAYLYAGNNAKALQYATQVINQASTTFPWTPLSSVNSSTNPDRVFSTEVLFGIQNLDLYTQFNQLFNSSLSVSQILMPLAGRLTTIYEGNENDYRFSPWWKVPVSGVYSSRTFFKYEDVIKAELDNYRRYFQPLIRMTEMYYIAAEAEMDNTKAFGYLNTVRFNRGLPNLPFTALLQTELQKEYTKEFYGEGQLFFYYKRKAITAIPNGSSTSGNVTLGDAQYVIPIPLSESGVIN